MAKPGKAASTVNPWGPKMFNIASRRHAHTFGFTNTDRNTAHGHRKKGTTIIHSTDGVGVSTKLAVTRHKHIETGVSYDEGTLMGRDKAQASLHGLVYDGTSSDYVDQTLRPIDRSISHKPTTTTTLSTKQEDRSNVQFEQADTPNTSHISTG